MTEQHPTPWTASLSAQGSNEIRDAAGRHIGYIADTEAAVHIAAAVNGEAQWRQLQRQLEDITPGGSEFYDKPETCLAWIQQRLKEKV